MQRTTLILIIILLVKFVSFGQDNNKPISKLEFHSVSFSILDFYITNKTGGVSFKADVSFDKDVHIIKFQALTSVEYQIFASYLEIISELNLYYGREFSLNNWLYYDIYGGLGFFKINNLYNINNNKSTTIGFPIQNRLRLQTKKKFGGGFQFQVNLNTLRIVYSPGFFLQWTF